MKDRILFTLTALVFLAIGAAAGHYHGVETTLQGIMGAQTQLMRDLEVK